MKVRKYAKPYVSRDGINIYCGGKSVHVCADAILDLLRQLQPYYDAVAVENGEEGEEREVTVEYMA